MRYGTNSHIRDTVWHGGDHVSHGCWCHMDILERDLRWDQGLDEGPLLVLLVHTDIIEIGYVA